MSDFTALEALGATLLHFLWQGALIAVLLAIVLRILETRPARERYAVRCGALLVMALCPFVTFVHLIGERTLGLPAPLLEAAPGAVREVLPDRALLLVVMLWSAGLLVFWARLVLGWSSVLRLSRTLGSELDPAWRRRFDRLARQLQVRARVRLVEGARVTVPLVIGCIKPLVLLPARMFSGLTDEQILAILAHELAHIRRRDYLINILQSFVEILLFYHPLVWWVSRGIRTEREYCCDDVAVATTRDALSYARALAELEAWRGRQLGLEMSTHGGSLMDRIHRLIGLEQATRPRKSRRNVPLATLVLILGAVGAFAAVPESVPVAEPAPPAPVPATVEAPVPPQPPPLVESDELPFAVEPPDDALPFDDLPFPPSTPDAALPFGDAPFPFAAPDPALPFGDAPFPFAAPVPASPFGDLPFPSATPAPAWPPADAPSPLAAPDLPFPPGDGPFPFSIATPEAPGAEPCPDQPRRERRRWTAPERSENGSRTRSFTRRRPRTSPFAEGAPDDDTRRRFSTGRGRGRSGGRAVPRSDDGSGSNERFRSRGSGRGSRSRYGTRSRSGARSEGRAWAPRSGDTGRRSFTRERMPFRLREQDPSSDPTAPRSRSRSRFRPRSRSPFDEDSGGSGSNTAPRFRPRVPAPPSAESPQRRFRNPFDAPRTPSAPTPDAPRRFRKRESQRKDVI